MSDTHYQNPLTSRYSSEEMSRTWSPQTKFSTWRQLWIALAEAQQELGLAITDEQIEEMRRYRDTINFAAAATYERKLRHDVMAHVHAFGDQCPAARPIIHWGATSCFVTDNTDLILLRSSLEFVRDRLVAVIDRLAKFATDTKDIACLGYTHLQPAQPTTVGKRACLWVQDLVLDLAEVEHRQQQLRARSIKGTTGTQASFLKLLEGDHDKVRRLEKLVTQKIGFEDSYPVTGQTYPRKLDSQVLDVLSGIAQSAHRCAGDLRLLASRKEVEEPFETSQVGSSAMAYKRNPMRSERICGLARFVMSLTSNTAQTAATQWMERTLDDSANRRLVLPQAFLATDAILILYENIATGLVVYPQVIKSHLWEELPMMATENILMAAVAAGGDRQTLHERIRQHSQAAASRVKNEGEPNDLLERLGNDPAFEGVDLQAALEVSQLKGRATQQVDEFVSEVVDPIRQRYPSALETTGEVRV
jgi:adenylosuccinate lyase